MKRGLWLAIAIFFLASPSDAFSQDRFAFGVRPSTVSPQAAYFGYLVGNSIVITGALQYLGGGLDVTYTDDYYDEYSHSDVDGAIWVPSIGMKYYIGTIGAGVSPYLHASLFTAIPVASGGDEIEEAAEDASCFGLGLAFGAEYFLHKQFSIGAEFGLNMVLASYDSGNDEASIDMEATYAAMSLNFFL